MQIHYISHLIVIYFLSNLKPHLFCYQLLTALEDDQSINEVLSSYQRGSRLMCSTIEHYLEVCGFYLVTKNF